MAKRGLRGDNSPGRPLLPFLLLVLLLTSAATYAGECKCTCVVKDDGGQLTTLTASGKDREAAGEALKKKLGKRTCELSPDCQGKACTLD